MAAILLLLNHSANPLSILYKQVEVRVRLPLCERKATQLPNTLQKLKNRESLPV